MMKTKATIMKSKILLSIICLSNIFLAQGRGQTVGRPVSPKWKVYTNTKYDFTFQYPRSWIKSGKDAEIPNASGEVATVEVYFTDSVKETVLLFSYHLAPKGGELF